MIADPQDPTTWESADGHCCWLVICPACSAVVYDAPDHVAWHERLAETMVAAGRADMTTNVIGPKDHLKPFNVVKLPPPPPDLVSALEESFRKAKADQVQTENEEGGA